MRAVLAAAIRFGLVAATVLTVVPAVAAGPRTASVDGVAARLQALVASESDADHQAAIALVRRGPPPAALVAFLVAVRNRPAAVFANVLAEIAQYRRAKVRGQALAALAALGPYYAHQAIVRAADDPDRGVRRLAWALAQTSEDPRSAEVVAQMLQRDPELAAELTGEATLVPDGPAPTQDAGGEDEAEDEIVIVEEEASP